METGAKSSGGPSSPKGPVQPSTLPQTVEIRVVGFCPVGAAVANPRARHRAHGMVVDKSIGAFMAPRAIALDKEALRSLQLVGITGRDFETVALPQLHMSSPMLGTSFKVGSLGSLDGQRKLVEFHRPAIERCLSARLETYECAHIALGAKSDCFIVFLAGDVVRVTPPLVRHGLVAGLRNAANLCWKLAWVDQRCAGPRILKTDDEVRRLNAKAMINLARFIRRFVMPRNGAIALLTHGVRLSSLVRRLHPQFEYATQPA